MSLDLGLGPEVHAYRPRSQAETALILGLSALVLCGYCTAAARHGAGLMNRVCGLFSSRIESSTSEEWKAVVQRRMLEFRVMRVRIYLLLVCCVHFPWLLALVVAVAQGSFSKTWTPAAEIGWLVFTAACALVLCKPALLTPRNLDVASLCVVAHAVIQETPFVCCTEEGFLLNTSGFTLLLLILGLNVVRGLGTLRETVALALGSILFMSSTTYTRWRAFRSEEAREKLSEGATAWCLVLALAMALGAVIETGYRQLVTQGLQLAEAREMHKAATALLRSCHDVVVELDSSGSLDCDGQDLGSLLLRAAHQRSMRGVKLADLFVDEEDGRKFQHRLAASRTKSVGLAENMHVTMKDALGNTLHMEMMWFACKRAEGGVHFIVGIRELWNETQEAPEAQCHGGPSHCHYRSHSPSRTHWAPDFFPCPAATAGTASPSEASSSSEGTASSPLAQPEHLDVDTEQAMMIVDITRDGCPIRSTTTGFRTQVGYVPRNAPLSRLVKKSGPVVVWLQEAVNSVMNSVPPPADHKVSLRMPLGKLRACCRLVITEVDAEMASVDAQNVVVLLYNITNSRSHEAGESGSGSGSGRAGGAGGTPARASRGPLGLLAL